jgi:hypothetical protein
VGGGGGNIKQLYWHEAATSIIPSLLAFFNIFLFPMKARQANTTKDEALKH